MKKSDLKYGNVVETREGMKYLYHCNNSAQFLNLDHDGFLWIRNFDENLKDIDDLNEFDIMKVYKDYTLKELLWERKETKLTKDEKVILRNIYKEYKWITRDEEGDLAVHNVKPYKSPEFWVSESNIAWEYLVPFNNLFQFIKWEDDEPYLIEDLLGGENND